MTLVDTHVHLWEPTDGSHPWMQGEYAGLRTPAGADRLAELAAPCGVHAAIVVQAESSERETVDLLAVTARHPLVRWAVGWVDLTAPDVAATLAALQEQPGRLVGVRHQVHDEPDAGWLDRADVRAGLRAVADAGLAFDLLVRDRELPAAVRCARELPQLRLVLDHAGKPPVAAQRREPWTALVRELAASPNVACKLSGLVTEARWAHWQVDDLRPYAEVVLDAFGPERVMLGSDWPVSTLAASYGQVWQVAADLTAALSPHEQEHVRCGTAERWYRCT